MAGRASVSVLRGSSLAVHPAASRGMGVQTVEETARFTRDRRLRTRRSVQGLHRQNRWHDHLCVQVCPLGRCPRAVGSNGLLCSAEWMEQPEHCVGRNRGA